MMTTHYGEKEKAIGFLQRTLAPDEMNLDDSLRTSSYN